MNNLKPYEQIMARLLLGAVVLAVAVAFTAMAIHAALDSAGMAAVL